MSTSRITLTQWIGFISMVFGMFMAVLDIQIVASSVRQIQAGLSASADEIVWVQSSYLIAEVIMIPISGWLAHVYSTRVLFTVCCAIFTIMSVACACATNLDSMIVFRALQGFFGGAMIPTVFAVIFTSFPVDKRPMLTVIVGLVVTLAPSLGPVLGGYLTDHYSWHYLFLINILPGIAVCFVSWHFVDIDQPHPEELSRIDWWGILWIALCLSTLQYVLEEGSRKQWFDDSRILILSLVSLCSAIALFYRELTCAHPIISFKAFRDANFTTGCILSFIIGVGLYGMVYLLPVYLATVKGLNSYQIGIYVSVTGAFQLLSAPVAGNLSKYWDPRIILAIGLGLFASSGFFDAHITAESGFEDFFLPQALRGFSLMFCFVPINSIALGTLPMADIKSASGLYNLMRNLGGAIGLAILNTSMIRLQKVHYAHLREHVTAGSPLTDLRLEGMSNYLQQFPGIANPDQAALTLLTQTVQREALILTFIQLFQGIAILFVVALCSLFFVKKVSIDGSGGGH
jgi:DHA2 family multidrug resistance protein